jgi:hypothetical protein
MVEFAGLIPCFWEYGRFGPSLRDRLQISRKWIKTCIHIFIRFLKIWPHRLAVQDSGFSVRQSGVRIPLGSPKKERHCKVAFFLWSFFERFEREAKVLASPPFSPACQNYICFGAKVESPWGHHKRLLSPVGTRTEEQKTCTQRAGFCCLA